MGLSKYKLKNIPKGQTVIASSKLPAGRIAIEKLTDETAGLLYNEGKSAYVELAKGTPEKTEAKK